MSLQTSSLPGGRQRLILIASGFLFIVIATSFLYAPRFDYPFVFDDKISIVMNPFIRQAWPITRAMDTTDQNPLAGRPIASYSLALSYAVSTLEPWGYRVMTLGLHFFNVLLVIGILSHALRGVRWIHATFAAVVLAGIWSIHPLNVDSLVYITQRTEVLVSLFLLLTLWLAIRGFESNRPATWLLSSVTACAFGMLTKENMVGAPILIYLYDRAFVSQSWIGPFKRRKWFYAALASTWIVLGLAVSAVHRGDSVGFHHGVSAWTYFTMQCQVIVEYLLMVFGLGHQVIHHEVMPLGFPAVIPAFIAIVGIIVLSIYAMFKHPRFGFAGLWFLIILAPTSSVLPIVTEPMAERRMYLPMLSVLVLTWVAVAYLWSRCPQRDKWRPVAAVFLIALTAGLLIRTSSYLDTFRTGELVWRQVLTKYPHSSWAWNNLGVELRRQGHQQQAYKAFENTLLHQPNHKIAPTNMALILIDIGRYKEAETILSYEIERDKADSYALPALALLKTKQGDYETAIEYFEKGLELRPHLAQNWNDYAKALEGMGRLEEAINAAKTGLSMEPSWILPHRNLATLLTRVGRFDEAMLHINWLLEQRPNHRWAPRLHDLAAVIAMIQDRPDDALDHYRKAVKLDPDNGVIHGRLARVLIETGQLEKAKEHLESIREPFPPQVDGGHPTVLDAWARYYAAQNDPEQAATLRAMIEPARRAREAAGLPSVDEQMQMEVKTGESNSLLDRP